MLMCCELGALPKVKDQPRVSAALRSRDAGEGRASLGDARVMALPQNVGELLPNAYPLAENWELFVGPLTLPARRQG